MKHIRLLKLNIRNFKGIRKLNLDADGGNVSIYGDNATGKTTLFDAFLWVLFDKDSEGRSEFAVKTLDKDGNVLHGLDHEVEAVLDVSGKQITFRKVYREKWTKKRGSATAEFTGHETDYYVNGVPVKQKEYKEKVAEIIDENAFKLLTNPAHFNEQLKWQERRKILMEVCGDVSFEDVVNSNKALAILPDILNGNSVEEHKRIVNERRKMINRELEKIPIRIDEVQRSIPELPETDEDLLAARIEAMREEIDEKETEIQRIKSGGEVAVKEKRLREIEAELIEIKNRVQADTIERMTEQRLEVLRLTQELVGIQSQIKDKQAAWSKNERLIEELKAEANALREKWKEINAEQFEHEQDIHCPTCGQALPEDQILLAHQKAEAEFNRQKAERLEEISKMGKRKMDEVRDLEEANEKILNELASLKMDAELKESELQRVQIKLDEIQASMTDVEDNLEYIQKKQEKADIEQEIQQLRMSVHEAVAKTGNELTSLRAQVQELEREKAKFEQVRAAEERIKELQEEERRLADEYEQLEHELFMLEEFIRTKVNLLEERINSKFKLARFKLFEQQINGGLQEVCETMVDGVPYNSMNNAARINVGLDIINTLSEHFGFSAPIFIDNAEAVTNLLPTIGQQIRLVVSEKDKQLRVELENKNREAV